MTSIGIGVTTRNRPDQVRETVRRIREMTPSAYIAVVDDASDERLGLIDGADVTVRLEENVGVARAKNRCLEVLDGLGLVHIFLFDDDAWPVAPNWWVPYVESPEPHLMYQFLDLAGPRKLHDITELYRDDRHIAYSGPRGVMLYVDAAAVLPVVGGMDPIFGKWGYEHGDWSNRIHHAGLTSFRYADVVGSEKLIHSMDEYEEIERSVPTHDRRKMAAVNARIHNERRDSGYRAYVPFARPLAGGDRDVVITHLYSGKPDPQRPESQLPAGTLDPAKALLESIKEATAVVITDSEIETDPYDSIDIVLSAWSTNVFFQRHLDSWRYLRDHPEIRYVWCVDATDVEMLHEPWGQMQAGRLYIGYEPKVVDDPWLKKNHPSTVVQHHIRSHGQDTMINPGVIGGDRETVMAFLHDMIRLHFDLEARRFWGREPSRPDLGDMGLTQVVARMHKDKIITGPLVVSEFRAEDRDAASWWKHK